MSCLPFDNCHNTFFINDLNSIFGAGRRPFIYQEVIDLGGEPIKNTDYSGFARVTEFKYGQKLSEVIFFRFLDLITCLKL